MGGGLVLSHGKVQRLGSAGSVQQRTIFCPSGTPLTCDYKPHAHKMAAEIKTLRLHSGQEERHKDKLKKEMAANSGTLAKLPQKTFPVIFTHTFLARILPPLTTRGTRRASGLHGHTAALPQIGKCGYQPGNAQYLLPPL